MKVSDLIEKLKTYHPEAKVVIRGEDDFLYNAENVKSYKVYPFNQADISKGYYEVKQESNKPYVEVVIVE